MKPLFRRLDIKILLLLLFLLLTFSILAVIGVVSLQKVEVSEQLMYRSKVPDFLVVYFFAFSILFLVSFWVVLNVLVFKPIRNVILAADSTSGVPELKKIVTSSSEIEQIKNLMLNYTLNIERNTAKKFENQAELAAQIAHDIRAPLAALVTLEADSKNLPENSRKLMEIATRRIKEIANDLLAKYREVEITENNKDKVNEQPILALLDSIVSEKQFQYKSRTDVIISIDKSTNAYGLFSKLVCSDFRRTISNLIDNSVESLVLRGRVNVSLCEEPRFNLIKIEDNGRGIPAVVLERIGEKGFTFGKKKGNGLGLYYAKRYIESCGGHLTLNSNEVHGTVAEIRLPKSNPPTWFVPQLLVNTEGTVVVVDDNSTVHHVWEERLLNRGTKLLHFFSGAEVKEWTRRQGCDLDGVLFLMDYEFNNEKINGLQIIEELRINKRSVLVTGRDENPKIRENCIRIGTGLVPKVMAGVIPIVFRSKMAT